MINPDVTHGKEVSTWAWIAGAVLVTVLVAMFVLGDQSFQVASVDDPVAVPPFVYLRPAPYL